MGKRRPRRTKKRVRHTGGRWSRIGRTAHLWVEWEGGVEIVTPVRWSDVALALVWALSLAPLAAAQVGSWRASVAALVPLAAVVAFLSVRAWRVWVEAPSRISASREGLRIEHRLGRTEVLPGPIRYAVESKDSGGL